MIDRLKLCITLLMSLLLCLWRSTSTKEVIFYLSLFVCLFVRLCLAEVLKNLWIDFDEIFKRERIETRNNQLKFGVNWGFAK